jgi:GTP cyclohydrolase I
MKELTNDNRVEKIAEHFKEIMLLLGLDLQDDSLKDTPLRVAKMYVNEIFSGLFTEQPKLTSFENTKGIDQIVIVKNIEMTSVCEHHFMPIVGKVHIGYIPDGKVLGLSKFNRVVQYVSARPQLQERILQDIHGILTPQLGENIIIVAEAVHFCSCMRGPKDMSSATVTSLATGMFRYDKSVKDEFFKLLGK